MAYLVGPATAFALEIHERGDVIVDHIGQRGAALALPESAQGALASLAESAGDAVFETVSLMPWLIDPSGVSITYPLQAELSLLQYDTVKHGGGALPSLRRGMFHRAAHA